MGEAIAGVDKRGTRGDRMRRNQQHMGAKHKRTQGHTNQPKPSAACFDTQLNLHRSRVQIGREPKALSRSVVKKLACSLPPRATLTINPPGHGH